MIYQNCNCVVYVCIFNIIYIVANVRYERLYNIYYSHSYLNHTKKKKSFGFVTSMGFELKFSFKSVFEIFILVNRQWFSVQVKQLFYA